MAEQSINPFLELLHFALKKKWCYHPSCTTCGGGHFRSELQRLDNELGGLLADAISEVNLDELTSIPEWNDAIWIALRELPLPRANSVLDYWLVRSKDDLRLFDVILYKLVRFLPEEHPSRVQWIGKGIALAVETRDYSLTESLLLTLRDKAVQHEQLMHLAMQIATTSEEMQRILQKVCKTKTEPAQQNLRKVVGPNGKYVMADVDEAPLIESIASKLSLVTIEYRYDLDCPAEILSNRKVDVNPILTPSPTAQCIMQTI